MSGVAATIGVTSVVGAGIAAYGASQAADKASDAADKASGITAEAARKARLDVLALANPALKDFATGVNSQIDALVQGRANTYDIMRSTTENAGNILQQGSDAAQRALLGSSGGQTNPIQAAQQDAQHWQQIHEQAYSQARQAGADATQAITVADSKCGPNAPQTRFYAASEGGIGGMNISDGIPIEEYRQAAKTVPTAEVPQPAQQIAQEAQKPENQAVMASTGNTGPTTEDPFRGGAQNQPIGVRDQARQLQMQQAAEGQISGILPGQQAGQQNYGIAPPPGFAGAGEPLTPDQIAEGNRQGAEIAGSWDERQQRIADQGLEGRPPTDEELAMGQQLKTMQAGQQATQQPAQSGAGGYKAPGTDTTPPPGYEGEPARFFPDMPPQEAAYAYSQLPSDMKYKYGPEGRYKGENLPTSSDKGMMEIRQQAKLTVQNAPVGTFDSPLTDSIYGADGVQSAQFGAFQAPTSPTPGQDYTQTGMTGIAAARNDINQGLNQSIGAYERGIGTLAGAGDRAVDLLGQADISGYNGSAEFAQGQKRLSGAEETALAEVQRGTQAGVGELSRYADTGEQALYQEAAMSGAYGLEAQQQAYNQFAESPAQAFMREREEQALLRNSAAIGGLGGGNVRTALQEQAVGIASQQEQQYLENLRSLSGMGLEAAGQQGQFQQTGGIAGGELISNLAQASANLSGQAGQTAASSASQAAQRALDRQGLAANMVMQSAQNQAVLMGDQAGLYTGAAQNLSGIAERGGVNLANMVQGNAQDQANLQTGFGSTMGGVEQGTAANLSNVYGNAATGQANIRTGTGTTLGGIATGTGTQQANIAMQSGAAQAAATQGQYNAIGQGISGVGLAAGYAMMPNGFPS